MAHVVRQRAQEEPEGDDPAEQPLDHRLHGGIDLGDLDGAQGRDEGDDEDPAELQPDLDAQDPGDGDADHALPWPRRPASQAVPSERTKISAPTAIAVSDQNCSGNSWTSRSVPGSKR